MRIEAGVDQDAYQYVVWDVPSRSLAKRVVWADDELQQYCMIDMETLAFNRHPKAKIPTKTYEGRVVFMPGHKTILLNPPGDGPFDTLLEELNYKALEDQLQLDTIDLPE